MLQREIALTRPRQASRQQSGTQRWRLGTILIKLLYCSNDGVHLSLRRQPYGGYVIKRHNWPVRLLLGWPLILALAISLQMAACAGPEPTVPTPTSTSPPPNVEVWQPELNTSWQWQLKDPPVDQSVDVDMYDIDLFDNDAAIVEALHAQDRRVVCYMNAGGWEDWRSDAGQFPNGVIGANLDDWEGERWLDIRRIDVLGTIIEARMDLCAAKGFDGIEPDNIDGFLNDTGFALTYEDQRLYNIWLANTAHQRGLSIGLKNDMEQITDLLPHFDWALNEQCFEYDECETLLPFIQAVKPVFHVEYELDTGEFCEEANNLNFNSMKKNLNLDAWSEPCS